MAKDPESVYALLGQLWKPALRRGQGGGRGAAGDASTRRAAASSSSPGTGGTTPRRSSKAALRPGRRGIAPLLRARERARGRLRLASRCGAHLRRARRHPDLPPGGRGLRGQGRRRLPPRRPLRRLLPAGRQARRRLDEVLPQPAHGRRPGRATGDLQRRQLLPAHRRQAGAAQPRRGAKPCSTSSATPCTACCPTAATSACPAPRVRATSSSCRRRSWRTGRSSRRCSRSTPSTTRPARRSPTELVEQDHERAPVQPGLRDRRVPGGLASWTWTGTPWRGQRARRGQPSRRQSLAAHRPHPRDRRALPQPLLQPHLRRPRRLLRRLLQLHLGRGAGRRRLRGLQGERDLRPDDRQAPSATTSSSAAAARTRWSCTRASAVAEPSVEPLLAKRGLK